MASHFGGVWERAIGQIRQVLQGYLLPKSQKLLSREEFHTMILHAARIVNSTPLWNSPENPNDPQPITPHHLITQRDDSCDGRYTRPTIHSSADLMAYGTQRWKRIEALADAFWQCWQAYIFNAATNNNKWIQPERNVEVGDLVLMKDKSLPRLW